MKNYQIENVRNDVELIEIHKVKFAHKKTLKHTHNQAMLHQKSKR